MANVRTMAPRAALAGLLSFLPGCEDHPKLEPSFFNEPLGPTLIDAGIEAAILPLTPASDTPLLPNWCQSSMFGPPEARTSDPARLRALSEIADAYLSAQLESCSGLTRGMGPAQLLDWRTYLYDYTGVMIGCVQISMPPPGGILAFGPANTAAVGATRVALSIEDASLLIEMYASIFARALDLGVEDRSLLEAHLFRSAAPEIDPAAMSACAGARDAGADGG